MLPAEATDRMLPAEPTDRIDPAEPTERMLPVDPMERIEWLESVDRTDATDNTEVEVSRRNRSSIVGPQPAPRAPKTSAGGATMPV